MDKKEIQQNLAGYLPELYQDEDPLIAESLRAAKADPELSQWLEEQIAFDREISEKAQSVAPPEGSREDLLKAYRSQADDLTHAQTSFFAKVPPKAWAIAALLFLSTAGLIKYFAFPPPVEFAQTANPTVETLRDQMAYFASQRFVLDKGFKTNVESAAWLEQESFPTLDQIPGSLVAYRGMGCKKITWQNTKVGLICFKNEANEIVHLFVVDQKDLDPSSHDLNLENVLVHHERETKGWRDQEQVYLLVGSEPGVKIGNLL